MDELGGARAGAAGVVAALDQRDRVPARGGVERDARARDPAADHQDVERLPRSAWRRRRCEAARDRTVTVLARDVRWVRAGAVALSGAREWRASRCARRRSTRAAWRATASTTRAGPKGGSASRTCRRSRSGRRRSRSTPTARSIRDKALPLPDDHRPRRRQGVAWGDPRLGFALERSLGRSIELVRDLDAARGDDRLHRSSPPIDRAVGGINVQLALPLPDAGGWAGTELIFRDGVRLQARGLPRGRSGYRGSCGRSRPDSARRARRARLGFRIPDLARRQ